jgi:hypothetical protein
MDTNNIIMFCIFAICFILQSRSQQTLNSHLTKLAVQTSKDLRKLEIAFAAKDTTDKEVE